MTMIKQAAAALVVLLSATSGGWCGAEIPLSPYELSFALEDIDAQPNPANKKGNLYVYPLNAYQYPTGASFPSSSGELPLSEVMNAYLKAIKTTDLAQITACYTPESAAKITATLSADDIKKRFFAGVSRIQGYEPRLIVEVDPTQFLLFGNVIFSDGKKDSLAFLLKKSGDRILLEAGAPSDSPAIKNLTTYVLKKGFEGLSIQKR